MEITDSLSTDLKDAPNWFHSSISNNPRQEILFHQLGNIKYQAWDRKDAENIVILIHGTGAHKRWWDPIAPLINRNCTIFAPDLPGASPHTCQTELLDPSREVPMLPIPPFSRLCVHLIF